MSLSAQARQAEIRIFTAGSFQAEHAREDIGTFKRAVYDLAQSYNLFEVIITDNDVVRLATQRVAARVQPVEPQTADRAAFHKVFDTQTKLYQEQVDKLAKLKLKVLQTMDYTAVQAIAHPLQGTLLMTTRDILEGVETAFSTLSNNEKQTIFAEWTSRRWDAADDLVTFMAAFRETASFLENHAYPISQGQQVEYLKAAVAHVPSFSDRANQTFFTAAPTAAQETLALLITKYTEFYRSQYVNSTAAQHHKTINQVKAASSPTDKFIADLGARACASLDGAELSAAQKAEVEAKLAKAIEQVMQPSRNGGGQSGGQGRAPQRSRASHERSNDRTGRSAAIPAGVCPLHPNAAKPHLWEDCFQNKNK